MCWMEEEVGEDDEWVYGEVSEEDEAIIIIILSYCSAWLTGELLMYGLSVCNMCENPVGLVG